MGGVRRVALRRSAGWASVSVLVVSLVLAVGLSLTTPAAAAARPVEDASGPQVKLTAPAVAGAESFKVSWAATPALPGGGWDAYRVQYREPGGEIWLAWQTAVTAGSAIFAIAAGSVVGLVVAVALGLALVFLAVRTGRGPMFMLSGCALLLPAAYIFFQAVLPLRQMGIEVDPAVGLGGMFFGNETNAGMGLSFWLTTAAGALLVLAGFIAPPRGWGRLLTFALFLAAVLGISFFCAASFNWNLFISEAAAVSPGAGRLTAGTIALLLPPLL